MTKRGWISSEEVHAELMRDDEFRALWEAEAAARELSLLILKYRIDHDLTLTALARKIGISQPALLRLEIGEHMPTMKTLMKISEALDIEILLDIKPRSGQRPLVTLRSGDANVVDQVTTAKDSELLVAAG